MSKSKYLLLPTMSLFRRINKRISEIRGYPKENGPRAYTNPFRTTDPKDKRILMRILPSVEQYVSENEKQYLVEKIPDNWDSNENYIYDVSVHYRPSMVHTMVMWASDNGHHRLASIFSLLTYPTQFVRTMIKKLYLKWGR